MPEKQWNTIRDRVLQKLLNIAEDEVLNDNNGFLTIPIQAEHCVLSLQKVMHAMLPEERIFPSGTVDYQAIREDRTFQFKFIPLTQQFRFFDPNTLVTRQEQIAFWINLYNALILHAVLQQNIQDSVNEGKWRSPAFFQRSAYQLNQLRISADDIEHGILRGNQGHPLVPGKQFAPEDPRHSWVIFPMDPRIHFALHSASKSSPQLRIYQPEKIDFQLTQAVNEFLNQHTQIDRVEYTLLLPNLVKWAQKDLGGPDKILELLMQAMPDEAPFLRRHFERWKIKYSPYDWALNQSKPGVIV